MSNNAVNTAVSNDPNIAFAPTRGTGAGRTPSVGADVQGALFPESRGRTPDVNRSKGPTVTPLKQALVAWRQQVVYAGTLSADTEVGLGSPPESGALLRKVMFRVRTTLELDASNYWTIEARWRDGTQTPIPLGAIASDTTRMTANLELPIYHFGTGVRMEKQHEATVAFTKTGSPSTLVQVTLYADWYVGV